MAIYTACHTGQSRASLAVDFQVSPSTINRIISRFQHHGSFKSLLRTGRPAIFTQKQTKRIASIIRRSPRITNRQLFAQVV